MELNQEAVDLIGEVHREAIEKIVGSRVTFTCTINTVQPSWRQINVHAPNDIGPYHPNGRAVAQFYMLQLPGCCGVAVSTSATVGVKYLKKGLGTLLNLYRIDLARQVGYGTLLCTDVDTNVPQRKILAKNGWKDIYQFTNPRTNHVVNITVKDLTAPKD